MTPEAFGPMIKFREQFGGTFHIGIQIFFATMVGGIDRQQFGTIKGQKLVKGFLQAVNNSQAADFIYVNHSDNIHHFGVMSNFIDT